MKKFSVIIPCWRQQRYLLQCVASVASQLIPGCDEVFIVMDGEEIEVSLRERLVSLAGIFNFDLIFLQVPDRRGVSVARNLALENAAGDWIKFLDADDIAAPFSFWAMRGISIPETVHVVSGVQSTVHNRIVIGQAGALWTDEVISCRNPALVSNVFVRRSAAQGVNGFDPRIEFEEDWDFWLRIRKRYGSEAFAGVRQPFCYYAINDEERAEKEKTCNHNVAGVDVREYLAQTYGITPDR